MLARSSFAPLSLSKAELKRLKLLDTKKGRESTGLFLVEGWKPAAEALASSWEVVSLIHDPKRLSDLRDEVLRACAAKHVEIKTASAADMRTLSDVVHDQGVVSVIRMRTSALRDLPPAGDVIILDGVSDPGNVGTLVRTADWFGFSAVIAGPGCASPYNEKVVRATMGSIFRVPITAVEDLAQACQSLKSSGFSLTGAVLDGVSRQSWLTPARTGLVLGSEAHGLSAEVRSLLTATVTIPRVGAAESLNVASAGAILMASMAEQRTRTKHASR